MNNQLQNRIKVTLNLDTVANEPIISNIQATYEPVVFFNFKEHKDGEGFAKGIFSQVVKII